MYIKIFVTTNCGMGRFIHIQSLSVQDYIIYLNGFIYLYSTTQYFFATKKYLNNYIDSLKCIAFYNYKKTIIYYKRKKIKRDISVCKSQVVTVRKPTWPIYFFKTDLKITCTVF